MSERKTRVTLSLTNSERNTLAFTAKCAASPPTMSGTAWTPKQAERWKAIADALYQYCGAPLEGQHFTHICLRPRRHKGDHSDDPDA